MSVITVLLLGVLSSSEKHRDMSLQINSSIESFVNVCLFLKLEMFVSLLKRLSVFSAPKFFFNLNKFVVVMHHYQAK